MPFIKYYTFKTGVSPSIRGSLDPKCLTGSQKLMLTSARIFGGRIGSNSPAGTRAIRAPLKGAKRMSMYDIPVWNYQQWFPFVQDFDNNEFRQEVFEDRKIRILMRGVKIGKKKGGTGFSLMNIFEKKTDKPETKGEKKGAGDKKPEAPKAEKAEEKK